MGKIFKNLLEHKREVLVIIALLIVQAFCELALPGYTSNIVDVGIQQYGIVDAVPAQLRKTTYDGLVQTMTHEDSAVVEQSYRLDEDGIYYLKEGIGDVRKELNQIFTTAILQYTDASESGIQWEETASINTQRAVYFVINEYREMGVDLGAHQTEYLLRTGGMMLFMSLLMIAAAVMAGFLAARTAAKIGRNLRSRVFNKVVSFSNRELDQFSTASLITRSTNDIQQIQMVSVMLLRMVIYAPILGIGGVLKVMTTRTGMGWIIGVAVGLIVFVVGTLMKITLPKFQLMQTLVDRLNLVSREILTGIPVIRALSREKYEEKRFQGANKELMETQLFTNRVMTLMMPLMMLIMNGITVLIVWTSANGIDAGRLQVGDMMAFITYTMQIVMSFLMLTMISIMLPRAGVAAERIQEVIVSSSTIFDKAQTEDEKLPSCKGILTFEDVSFRYPDADEYALEHISFTARNGQTTAIIGSTGCGKSTLVHLIPRFYDVTEGRILIDGIDIRDLSQKKLRSLLGFVPQKSLLFSGTIASNIKFANENMSDDQMERAAKIAQAESFIMEKDGRYESPVSQGGTNVSGGQKQRLSIARAIAGNPSVCIFDDSFSALDYKTDVTLRKALKENLKDATILIVAQRISTILHAEQIIVLEDGKMVGKGTHAELLKTCESYQEIAKSQLSEAELKEGGA